MGTGKTTFVQGVAKALGIKKRVLSPTFVFVRSYKGLKKDLVHVDLYRIESHTDLHLLGLNELFTTNNKIIVIEWAKKAKKILPNKRIDVFFTNLGGNERQIKINFRD